MKKRLILTLIISILMCLILSWSVSAYTLKSGECGDNVSYRLDSSYNLFISGSGDMWDFDSAETPWNSYSSRIKQVTVQQGVTSIGDYSFEDFTSLTNLEISRTVKRIGWSSFYGCTSLSSLNIPSSVTTIEGWAFGYCSALTIISIPSSVTYIGTCAFIDCNDLTAVYVNENNLVYSSDTNGILYNKDKTTLYICPSDLRNVTIPSTVTAIERYAFEDCDYLTSISIPSSVKNIDYRAFYHCSNLSSISIGSGVAFIGEEAFRYTAYYNNSNNWQNNALYISNWLIEASASVTGFYTTKSGTKGIAESAFEGCSNLIGITLSNGVNYVNDSAFYDCSNLMYITLPDTVMNIGSGAFGNTSYYDDIGNWYNGVLYIGKWAIDAEWDIGFAFIKNGTVGIADYAFYYCDYLETLTLPSGLLYIGKYAFGDCVRLNDFSLPVSLKSIGMCAFINCNAIENVFIPRNVSSIGYRAFSACDWLESIQVDANNQYFSSDSNGILYNKNKTTLLLCTDNNRAVAIPSTVNRVENYAFWNLGYLQSVKIPSSVKYIGNNAFEYSYNLKSVIITTPNVSFGSNIFNECDDVNVFGYMQSTAETYSILNGIPFHIISSNGIIDSGVCGDNLTYTLDLNGTLTVTGIGEMSWDDSAPWLINSAFIKKAIIGNGVTNIGYEAFDFCYNLESVSLPNTVKVISTYAFYSCSNLKSITLPQSVEDIYNLAFYGCESLVNIYIPSNVSYISSNAFNGCTSLEAIKISPDNLYYADIDGVIFDKNCETLIKYPVGKKSVSYTVPDNVLTIDDNAFSNNYLTEINIGNNINYLTPSSFSGAYNLNKINVSADNNGYSTDSNGILYNNDKSELIYCPAAKTSVTIPTTVKRIGENSFRDCYGLYNLNIPSNVNSIGYDAFIFSGLYYNDNNWDEDSFYVDDWLISATCEESYDVEEGVVGIADGALANNSDLKNVSISSTVRHVGRSSFNYCQSLTEIYVDSDNAYYSNDANGILYNKDKTVLVRCPEGKTSAIIPDTVKTINSFAFANTVFETIQIPYGVEVIGYMSFYCSSLASVEIPDSVKIIDDFAFYYSTELDSIILGNGVESIGQGVFSLTGYHINSESDSLYIGDWLIYCYEEIPEFIVADGTKGIASGAFINNIDIANVSLPDTLKFIGEKAFLGCSGIDMMIIPSSVITIGDYAFDDCDITLYGYSDTCAEAYALANNIPFLSFDNIRYNIVYDANGGTINPSTETKKYDKDYFITNTIPTRDGFDFLGWAIERGGEVEYESGDVYSKNANLTLYAVWSSCIKLNGKRISIGKNISMPVTISNNLGINSMRLVLGYDKEALELVSVENGDVFEELEEVNLGIDNPSIVNINGLVDTKEDGTVFILNFKVKDSASLGEHPITLTYETGDIINANSDDVPVKVNSGIITVVDTLPGDSNGDGEINKRDILLLRKYLADWEVEVDEAALDVNCDGSINMKDSLLLRKYLAGWDVQLGVN